MVSEYAKDRAHALARNLRERKKALKVVVLKKGAHYTHVVDRVHTHHHQLIRL